MADYINLPRSALGLTKDDALWKIYGYLLSKADDKGVATITSSEIKLRFGISRQRLRTMLEKLVKNGVATNCQPTANQQATNKQTTKRAKKTIIFTPPTDAEVAAYVAEKGYHFNPAQFVPHYQSKGWRVGSQPMKDWHAACRTWENTWKEKHGEQFYYEIRPVAAPAFRSQADRYSELESAAERVLLGSTYYDAPQND